MAAHASISFRPRGVGLGPSVSLIRLTCYDVNFTVGSRASNSIAHARAFTLPHLPSVSSVLSSGSTVKRSMGDATTHLSYASLPTWTTPDHQTRKVTHQARNELHPILEFQRTSGWIGATTFLALVSCCAAQQGCYAWRPQTRAGSPDLAQTQDFGSKLGVWARRGGIPLRISC